MNYLAQVEFGKPNIFGSPFGDSKNISDLISVIIKLSFVGAGILVLFLIAFAGVSIIMSAGSSKPDSAAKGMQAATAALIGFVVIFVAYWIIRLVEIATGVSFITEPTI